VLRAIASLIVVVGLIVWLGKKINADGSGSAVANLTGPSGAKPRRKRTGGVFSFAFASRSRGDQQLIQVVGRQALVGRTAVTVVDVDGQRLVLGVTDTNVSVLHSRELRAGESATDAAAVLLGDEQAASSSTPADAGFAAALTDAVASAETSTPEAGEPTLAEGLVDNGDSIVDLDTARTVKAAAQPTHSSFSSRLDGSILSPNTWRQAKAAMKVARVGGNKTTRDTQTWR
jgi:flagellar protein FliO/FliZ